MKRLRVAGHDSRALGRVTFRPPRVPTADCIMVQQRIEQRPSALVHGHRSGLHAGRPVAQMVVLVEHLRDGPIRLQDARADGKHPGAGQRMEV